MKLPPRIGDLIGRIEAGETITQKEVDRIALLQSLDIAKAGEDFVSEWVERERETIRILESSQ
jgi:hypothetical protein